MIKSYYVYVHRRADNDQVFYVGCATKQPGKRGHAPYCRAYDFTLRTQAWFNAKLAAGGCSVEFVMETDDRNKAFDLERNLIKAIGRADIGAGTLVNQTNGGPGADGQIGYPSSRLKKSIGKIGTKNPMYGVTGAAHPNSRKVKDTVTGTVYDSVLIAATARGFKMKTLYNWLSGHRPNRTTLEFM